MGPITLSKGIKIGEERIKITYSDNQKTVEKGETIKLKL